jgi:hypothetical protein
MRGPPKRLNTGERLDPVFFPAFKFDNYEATGVPTTDSHEVDTFEESPPPTHPECRFNNLLYATWSSIVTWVTSREFSGLPASKHVARTGQICVIDFV